MNISSVVRDVPISTGIFTTDSAKRLLKSAAFFVAMCGLAPGAWATANYVYHERTVNDPGCGGQYVTTLTPNSAQSHPLQFKVEYQFQVNTGVVYYTTDGSPPIGSFGNTSN